MSVWIQGQIVFLLLFHKQRVYLPLCCLLHLRPLGSNNMHGLVVGVYYDTVSVSLAVHFYFAEVDEHSDSEVVGVAAIADSGAMAALVGFEPLVGSSEVLVWVLAEEACCLGFCCLGNPSPCGP